jgi:hypothetical protein
VFTIESLTATRGIVVRKNFTVISPRARQTWSSLKAESTKSIAASDDLIGCIPLNAIRGIAALQPGNSEVLSSPEIGAEVTVVLTKLPDIGFGLTQDSEPIRGETSFAKLLLVNWISNKTR